MSILNENWFSTINRPSRYTGNEINSIVKDPSEIEVSVALAFPDVYEVGMSHLGLKILYHLLNTQPWLAAERVFSPWIDLEKELRLRNTPLTTLESGRPLSHFDMVGISLQHELSYTNVLTLLNLGGIPLLSSERDEGHPLIIGGGPACFNPEPVAEIFDAFVIGDGEEVALEICRIIREGKRRGRGDRKELLARLGKIKGVYIPSLFRMEYGEDGTIMGILPLDPSYSKVEKAIVPDLEEYPYPDRQVVPFTELVHDRLALEISRGCTRGCRFCQAGMIYRPVRERRPESVLKTAERALSHTGYDEISLLSLSCGDYSRIGPLLKALMDRQQREKVAVSLPSLRMDSFDAAWTEQIKRVRKTGFTLAAETGNDRLRRVINKGLGQEDILRTAQEVYRAGWNLIKLYFMIGLPTEEEKDVLDIPRLAREIAASGGKGRGRNTLNVSVSTFVPKSHTPFQWAAQISMDESRKRIRLVQETLRGTRIRVKWNQPELSWLEGIFSRGDRRLCRVLLEAWKMGARFDAWGECFRLEAWQEAFRRAEIDPLFYLVRERPVDKPLPWEHIHSGVSKAYLKGEWQRAQEGKATPDCRDRCLQCGVCDQEIVKPVLARGESALPTGGMEEAAVPSPPVRHRLTFKKVGSARFLGHLELTRCFIRALKRAGIRLTYSSGFHPMPKISFASALPVGTESLDETVDLELAAPIPPLRMMEALNAHLPSGIELTAAQEVERKERASLKESHFLVTVEGVPLKKEKLEAFLGCDFFPVAKKGKKGEVEVNARSLVKSMSQVSPNVVSLILIHPEGPGLKPTELLREVLFEGSENGFGLRVLKTKQVFF